MKSIKIVVHAALLVGSIWSIYALSISLMRAGAFCSARLSYLFLENFMFTISSVLPLVTFAFIISFIFNPIIRKIREEHIAAFSITISFLPIAFVFFAPQGSLFGVLDYAPAAFWGALSALGLGFIIYLLDRPSLRRLFNLLIVPAVAAAVATMPFLMKGLHELYWVKKVGFSFMRLMSFCLYSLPFLALFLIFLIWFKLKPKVAAALGWIFVAISACFTILQPALYTGPDISCKKSDGSDKPNVLFIVIDALRTDALEPYGGSAPTPNISEFAARSVLFENAYTVAPWTLPSMASFFTGLFPSTHGVSYSKEELDSKFDTIYRILKRNGYVTWTVLDQPLYTRYRGTYMYFDAFHQTLCHPCQILLTHPLIKKAFPGASVDNLPLCYRQTERVAHDTAAAIERSCRPFFGWVHFLDPHLPLSPPPEFSGYISKPAKTFRWGVRGKTKVLDVPSRAEIAKGEVFFDSELANLLRELYLDEVRYVDSEIARVFSALKRTNIWDKTIVIVTADHGEELLDHGGFEHGHSVYNEVLHIPLIIHVPNVNPVRVQTRVRTIDIAPTILELAGIKFESSSFQGQSLVPLMKGGSEQDREVLAESMLYYEEKKALIEGQYKLIWRPLTDEYALFNIIEDPKELYPIKGEESIKKQMLIRLRKLLTNYEKIYKQVTGKLPDHVYEPPAIETIEQLKALGYTY